MTRCEYDIGEHPWKRHRGAKGAKGKPSLFLLKNGVVVVLPRRLRGVFFAAARLLLRCVRLSAKS